MKSAYRIDNTAIIYYVFDKNDIANFCKEINQLYVYLLEKINKIGASNMSSESLIIILQKDIDQQILNNDGEEIAKVIYNSFNTSINKLKDLSNTLNIHFVMI